MQKESSLVVGKITKQVEDLLRFTILHDNKVYLEEEELNQMAKDYPSSYLRRVEEISSILHHPDFVGKKGEELHYFRFYHLSNGFSCYDVTLIRKGRPKKWCFLSFAPRKEFKEILPLERYPVVLRRKKKEAI